MVVDPVQPEPTPEQEAEAYESRWTKNEHGIEGAEDRSGRFIPRLCWEGCPLFEWDCDDDGWRMWHWCTRHVAYPTRKGTCKTRERALAVA